MRPIFSNLISIIFIGVLYASSLVVSPLALASPLECGKVEIKKTVNKDVQTFHERACTNKERTILISENCKTKQCKALSFDPLLVSKKDLAGQSGKPGFKICRKLSGSPSLIEFKIKKKWYALDECRFAPDNSFANTSELLEIFYNSRQK